jgi:hypothetical protein
MPVDCDDHTYVMLQPASGLRVARRCVGTASVAAEHRRAAPSSDSTRSSRQGFRL